MLSCFHLFKLLATEVQTNTVVEDERRACLAASKQRGGQDASDDKVEELRSLARVPAIGFGATAHVPAVEVDKEDDIVDKCMGDGNLDTGYHGALLLASLILFPRPAVLGDHSDELLVAGHDGRNGSDQASAEDKVGQTRDVEKGSRGAEAADQEVRLDIGGCEEVD